MSRHLALAAALLPLGAPCAHGAQASQDLETEVQLESAQEARLQGVLRKVLASDDVLVIVDLSLASEARSGITELLPGVPLDKTPIAKDLASLNRAMVKGISATVILDKSVPTDTDVLVQSTAESVLGLESSRGDTVTVKRMPLKAAVGVPAPAARDWVMPAPVVSLLWLFAAVLGVGLLYGRFLRPLLGVLREVGMARSTPQSVQAIPGAAVDNTGPPPPLEAAPQPREALPPPEDEDLPFSFLRERHVPMLKFLLRKAPGKTAAVIVHYLPAVLATEVLGALPLGTRQDVARAMSKVVQLEEENVRQIEDSLRARIDYLMGGEDKLAEILDQAPAALQQEMLDAVRGEDPEAAARLGRRIVRLEDIAWLDANDLKTLSRRVPIRSLAAVLRSDQELKGRVMPKLTAGLGAWLGQEIELAAELSGDRLASEQKRVLTTLAQLVKEGAVRLQRPDDAPAALPPPAASGAQV
ncbi:MAG: hypothetical protein HY928_02320 [Elusimicrobia bacterium]|nr:hypothetical protein [Elusimicrobiota bacterium]